jgi:rhodanese-related sulfurtransferase
MTQASDFIAIALDAKSRIQEITPVQLNAKLKNGKAFYLIDVREAPELVTGMIPTAVHVSGQVIASEISNITSDLSVEIVLYCSGGLRSAIAADKLQNMGYQHVFSLEGGFNAWNSHVK